MRADRAQPDGRREEVGADRRALVRPGSLRAAPVRSAARTRRDGPGGDLHRDPAGRTEVGGGARPDYPGDRETLRVIGHSRRFTLSVTPEAELKATHRILRCALEEKTEGIRCVAFSSASGVGLTLARD